MNHPTDSVDTFDRWLADAVAAMASEMDAMADTASIVEAMIGARERRRARVRIAVGVGLLAAAVIAGIAFGSLATSPPDVGPSPTEPSGSPTTSPSATAAPTESPIRVLPGGAMASTIDGLPVYAEPGVGRPFTTLDGQPVYMRGNRTTDDGAVWKEIQFVHPDFGAWVFGWVPIAVDGERALTALPQPGCPTQEEFRDGLFPPELPMLAPCLRQGAWSITGYLVRLEGPARSPYRGEPAWLADPPTHALVGAIGPAVTTWQLDLWLDPATVSVDDSWLNDRDGVAGLRVTVYGGPYDQAARACVLESVDPRLASPTPAQSVSWCQQHFVAREITPGFADGPATRPDIEVETCRNPAAQYSVDMPATWFTNPAGDVGTCSRFSPVAPPSSGAAPDGTAAIDIQVFSGLFGYFESPTYLAYERLTVAGFDATRSEQVAEDGTRFYEYLVTIGEEGVGPTLMAMTSETWPGDYAENKQVLDWMLRSLVIGGT